MMQSIYIDRLHKNTYNMQMTIKHDSYQHAQANSKAMQSLTKAKPTCVYGLE